MRKCLRIFFIRIFCQPGVFIEGLCGSRDSGVCPLQFFVSIYLLGKTPGGRKRYKKWRTAIARQALLVFILFNYDVVCY
jgi:hypothetical protein